MIHTEFYDFGDMVVCDWCDEDYTDSSDVGGLQFHSTACCPKCVPKVEELAKIDDEEHFILRRASEGQEFRRFVIDTLREGRPGTMSITSL